MYEVVIIGSGPAGLTAGVYLGRFKRKPLIIDGNQPGGQLMLTGAVENWPGDTTVQGPKLMKRMRDHAQHYGCEFLADSVASVDFSKTPFTIVTKNGKTLQAKSVIVATGSTPKKLGVPGEDDYWGKGVNVCATCDAPLYEGKNVAVVGGGDSAIAETDALSAFAKNVTIIQLLDHLTAADPLTDRVVATENVSVLLNKKVIEIKGDGERVTAVALEDQQTKEIADMTIEGVFVAIGLSPATGPFKGQLEIDEFGHIVRTEGAQTSREGVFVAGDVTDYRYRQAITASGQGCAAALECEHYLKNGQK